MKIRGKGYFSIRIFGMIILFCSFAMLFISDLILLKYLFGKFLIILLLIPWVLIYLMVKLEISPFANQKNAFYSFLIIYSLIISVLMLACLNFISQIIFTLIRSLIMILILTTWNFSLSIYRRRKMTFFITGIVSFILILLSTMICLYKYCEVFSIITSILIFIGLFIIILSEILLRKMGLMNYI